MSSENSISRANGITYPGFKDKVLIGDGSLTAIRNIRRSSIPEKASNLPGKGAGNTNTTSHSAKPASFQTGEPGDGVFADKYLLTHTDGPNHTFIGVPVEPILPTGHRRPTQLEEPFKSQLLSLAHDHKSDLATAVLIAWTIVLSRLSGQESIVVDVGGTFGKGTLIDPFTMNVDLSGELNTSKLFERVKQSFATTGARQSAVRESANLSKNDDEPHLSQASFFAHTGNVTQPLGDQVSKQGCLGLHLFQDKDTVTMNVLPATSLYNKETIERYAGYLEAVLKNMAANKSQPIALFDILCAEEKKLLLETWNTINQPYPGNTCLHRLFEKQVELSPEAIAIVHHEQMLTYRELNSWANWIACQLVEEGVKPGDYVMLLLDRSIDLVASQIAILKVGAAYVPIDTRAPVDRQVYIASDCGSTILVTDKSTDIPPAIQGTVLRISAKQRKTGHVQESFESPTTSSQDTACVMYTSGSTGRPKGVMVPHRGIARLAINNGYSDIGKDDRVAFVANPAFDHNSYEVWVPLLNGARIIIIDRETLLDPHRLAAALGHHQITMLFLTTALLHQYVHIIGPALSKLRYLMGAGEQGHVEAFTEVAKHGGRVCVINTYGPTEATVTSTAYKITSTTSQLRRLPIGRPISNTPQYVLDTHQRLVPIGVVGELYIGGSGVANGYLNRPDLTAERFLPDPFAKVQGARMYRTGDLVRYLPDGNLGFVGRNDNQVKIRGFRVELGEIEARLAEHSQVHEAVVLSLGEGGKDRRLVAYVVSAPQEHLVQTLHEYLSGVLPEYMIPSAFVRMDVFQLTNNGKIDRHALPDPGSDSLVTSGYVAPQGEHEIALAVVWSDLLNVERVGRHDNFFMLGGHSLLAVGMIEHLRRQGYTLSVRALFENPVLCTLATCLRDEQTEAVIPPNVISPATKALTPDMLPLINLTQAEIDLVVHQMPGGVANIQDIYALSPLQDGILFHHMMAASGDLYLNSLFSVFGDKGSLDRYLGAFQKVADRHDSLRTAIMWENMSTPAQVVLRQATVSVTEHSLDPLDGPIVDQLKHMYSPQTYRIELCEAPLTRFAYAQDVDGRWVLIHLLHHLIGDHSTLEIMEEEIDAILGGRIESLPAPQPIRNLIGKIRLGISVEEHERYFHKMLHDIDSPSLPYGLSDVYGDGCNVVDYHCMLPQDLNNKLRSHAKRLGVSLASLCHLAWAQVIAATSGQSKVVFGTVLFGRMQGGAGSDRAMGLFINTLPMRIDVEGAGVLDSVLKVQADLAGLLEHEHASLAVAQRCSGVPSGMPLFSSILNYRHNAAPSRNNGGRIEEEAIVTLEYTNYPFGMSVEDYGSSLGLTAHIAQPYASSTVYGYMQQTLQNLVESLELSPDTPIQTLAILPAEEYELLVRTWNNTDAPYPSDSCVHQLFEEQAESRPDAVAIQHSDRSMTYRMLSNYSSRLARKLIDLGVCQGDYVAILMERSFELIISQLAILKVGAAYVPIDTRAPMERQTYIVSDCRSKLLIADEYTDVPAIFNSSVLRFCLNDASFLKDTFDMPLKHSYSNLDTAYVMYTSGSTGLPKGVMISHQGIVNLVTNNDLAGLRPEDVIAFSNNPSFDPSTYDVWAPLVHGARIVVIDNDTYLDPYLLAEEFICRQITVFNTNNGLLHQYAYVIGDTLSRLKYLIAGSEQGSRKAYLAILQQCGPVRLDNQYGPTETTVSALSYTAVGAVDQLERLPIGRPISNTCVYVLNKHLIPAPLGVVGELYIGGPGVAKGYLNRPDLTAERFLPDPFAKVQGARMYKTGDLVRYLPDGNLVFVGRNDNQVKIRGFRVELGEIEARLAEHPQVREAVVLALGEGSDNKRLVAYVLAAPHESLVRTLREYLSVSLPEYMIPSAFVRMDVFPLTNNDKIDRRALPEPSNDSLATSDYVAPQGDLETALAAIWSDLLNVEQVGRHDNFFMLGGHSLLAVRLMNRVLDFGVHMPLSTLFSSPTLCALGEALESSANLQGSTHPVIVPAARDSPLELSFAQQRLWFLAQMDGLSEIYHVPFASRLHGPLNRDALEKTLNALFCRHESLRTVFVAIDGHPQVQLLPPDNGFPLVIRDLRGEQDGEAIARQLAAQESRTPFDLENGPLVRAQLIQLADDEHLFLITMHHIVTDGWSMGVMIREVNMLYEAYSSGLHNPLAPLSIQYPDYAVWQRQWLKQDKLKDQAAYWRENLAGAPAYIELPTDRPRPHQQSFSGASVPIRFDSQLTGALKSLSQKHGATMFMTTLAAWSAVLSRLSGQDDIVIGTPSANRNHQQLEQLIGFFVSTLVLRIDLSEEPSAIQLLERVRKTAIAAQAHQDIPFEQVVEIVQPPRRTDMTPLFQVMFAWQDEDHDSLKLHGTETISEDIHYDISKFELELTLGEHSGEIVGDLNYSTALFDRETINRHIGYLESILRWMTDSTEESIGKAPILGTSERELLFETWNTINQPYPGNTCLHQLFEKQVELSPEAIAIVHHEQMLTYRELNSWANWIACQLVEEGVKPGDYVMLLLDRSIDLVASQIAILKVGAAYVPIDTRAPVERQVYIASDCGSTILVTDKSTDIPPAIQGTVLRISAKQRKTGHVQESFESPTTSSQDTACVMYTSGSTGRPKGVMVPHRGIARLAINNGYSDIGKDDRVAFVANPAFDHNSYEVWVPLLNGARIIIIDRETLLDPHRLAAALDHHEITMLFLTTALLHQYVHIIGSTLSKLRYLMGAGEQGQVEQFTEVAKHGGRVCVINTYGPTEATVTSTAYKISGTTSQLRRLPIGRPISNTPQYVLDTHQRPVPIGVVGELYIGGPGVANGYLNRPDLTAERFLPDPFAKVQGARMYRTGDLVRYLPDGNLVFVGRNDNQVKIRGFRVELGEIEARLAEHPQVREAVVLVLGDSSDNKRLVAYIEAVPDESLVRTLREYLSIRLPEYMIPSAFVRMDVFQLTNNGKIDRRALPDPGSDSLVTSGYVAPQGEHEIALAVVWSDLLNVERVGRHDNFFMLGGHSLLAVGMIEHLRRQGYTLSVRALFENPVLCILATCVRDEQIEAVIPPNVISPATKALTPDMLPLINLNQAEIDLVVHQTPGGVANIQDIYALSPLQDGILFHHMMATSGDPYLTVIYTAFSDRELLDRYLGAFQKVVDRHDSLRTAIIWENLSTPAQVVLRQATVSVTEHSLDPLDGPIVDQLKHMYSPQTYRIELCEAPLTRFAYAQDVDGRWVLIHLLHHLIGDHSTLEIMEEEIDAILGGRIESLPAPQPIRNLIGKIRLGISVEEHERYFHKMLHDIDSPSLPYGLSDVYGDGCNVVDYHCMLPQDLNNKLRSHAKRLGVSLASLCHLAWAQVIAATSGQSKVVFGTVLFGRMQGGAGSDRAMGLFINTLPMRIDVEGAGVLDSVLKVQADLAGLLEHEHASLAVAQRCSGVPSGMPLFSSILNYRHNAAPSRNNGGNIGEEMISAQERTNYPVGMSVEDFGSSLGLTAQVQQPYEPFRICGYMQQTLHSLSESLEKSPDTPIQTLAILPAEEYELLVRTWNNTGAPYPSDRCIHQLFEEQAESRPDAVAIQHSDRSMTYRMLSNYSSRLARKLIDLGVCQGDYVAILMERSFELIISQLAILKVGAAYVPIDTRAPMERQTYIVSDCRSKLLIADVHTNVPAVFNSSVLRFCVNDANEMQDTFDRPLQSSWSSHDTAYVMYTSGSTGLPKGVLVPHRAIAGLLINKRYKDLGPDDRIGFVNNPAFDASTADIWGPLLHGARIVIIDNDTCLDPYRLAEALDCYHITSLEPTSALFHQYAFTIGLALSRLKHLISGGEQGLIEAYTEVLRHGGPVRLVNTYGPTETTVISTSYEATSQLNKLDRVPIGRPICNARLYVLDQYQKPVPIGVTGELYIGGAGVAKGYLNRPDLTAERFLPDPFAKVQGARMYRTGDLVRYLPDGNLVFVGRNDNQVKIRGFRVELGEIEARLAEHPQVREAVVLVLGDSSDNKRLVAYIEAVPDESLVRTLREYLSIRLPEYMIPSAFVRMDVFPLTNNGKIDRRALPEPSNDSLATSDYVAPQGDLETALAAIWSDLLNVEQVGRHDNFFMLGGHSLLAVRLMNRVLDFGVHMPLSTLFSSPTLCALGEALESSANLQGSTHPVIVPAARDSPLELSFAQQRLWFLAQMDGLSEIYHVPFASRLHGPLNRDALEKTLNALFCRHESLRTVFVAIDGHPQVQLLPPDNGFPLVIRDLRGEQDGEAIARQLAAQESRTPFDLENGPLVRAQLIQLADDEHLFLITMHHIVTDGWSMGVMIREVNMLYEAYSSGLHNPLAPLSIQYPDYAVWQRQWLKQDKRKDQAAYWRENLAGAPAYIELPTDRPRPHQQSFSGASVPIRFDSQLTGALKSLSQKHGATMFMTTLAAWSAVLSRLSGQDDIVIGTPSANRNHQQLEQLIGFFVSTLALRIDLSEEPSAIQLLERVRKTAIAAQAHQDIPFEQVVEIVQPPRRTDMTPLFQVMFAWQDEDHDSLKLHGTETISEDIHYDISKFELELTLGEHSGEIVGDLNYSTALFDRETINRHIGYLESILRWMTDSTEESIGKAPILGTSERELLFETWNTINQPYPGNTCLHQLFEKQVELSPEAIAIVHHEQMLTYRELNSWANWIACQLVEAGVKPGDYVMLLLDRSIDLVASQIAILKVGAAYVPIDTKAPVDRQVYIASDCGSTILVTDKSTDIPPAIQGTVLRISAKQRKTGHVQESFESPTTSSQDTAYVMYTSGSTGRPKGVMVPHRGVARLVCNNGHVDLGNGERVAFVSNPTFDASTFDVWVPLLNGARIVIIDRETLLNPHRLASALDHYQITLLFLTTALLHQYVHIIGPALSKLKYLFGAGEQGSVEAFTEVAKHQGRVCVINTYGATEASVISTAYKIISTTNQLSRLPIGHPLSNTPHYVLNEHRTAVPIGVVGELYLGGPGVANGYLNRPDLTAERFLPDPFAKVQGARMYKTGDLVRYLPDGNLVFVGRNDNQVKIRGFRVELGEIEARLAEHPQVREAVVLVLGDSSDNKRLVAYIEAVPDESLVRTLREYLSIRLPEYMIPSAFVRMDVFPLTNNGKIDRRALPEPSNDSLATSDYVAPQGDLETALAAIWSDLLNVEQVGRHDNFFMLGGHSLLAVRLMNRVLDFGVHMPLSTLFSSPTLCALGEALESSANLQGSTHPVIVPAARDSPLELSFAQQRLWFLAQMDGLSEIYHVPFASRLHGPLNRDALEKTLNALFCRHESLRTVFVAIDGHPQVQLLPPDNGFPLVIRDLRGEQDGEAIARQLAAQESRTPFDLENGPLVRAQLIQLADDEHLFLITMHHIVTDGWSMGVMIREVNMLYEAYSSGLHNPLAPLSIQYPDYAVWQRQWLKQDKRKDQAAYWRENLAGAPAYIELPTDRPRPHQQSFSGASVPIRFDSQLTGALKSLSQKHGATMFMTTLAAWSAVLSRLSGQDDIVIGTPSANRNHQQLEQLIGFFVSTLALRIDLSEEPSAIQLLERVRKTAIAAQAHQDIPFEQVVEIVQPPRRTDMTPLFQVMFAWQDNGAGTLMFRGIDAVADDLDYATVKFDLELFLTEEHGEIVGGLNYSTALFDRETINRHIGYLESILRWMTDSTEGSIGKAPILGTSERGLLLEKLNRTEQPYPDNTCLHQLFEKQVELSPEAIAIVHHEQMLTYRELNSWANWIACQLVEAGVKPGDYVMLLLDRSIDLVASQIAILKVGAAYVPIDTKAPVDRQVYIASDCGSTILITDKGTDIPPAIQGTELRISGKQRKTGHMRANLVEFKHATSVHDTAYIMYTSGSTGRSKGVIVPHRGIVNLITNNEFAELRAEDILAFSSNPAFDPSTYEIWGALVHGARIAVIDKDTILDPYRLAKELTRRQVTLFNISNGLLNQYAYLIGDTLSKLRYLIGGSEQGSCKAYSAILQHGRRVRFVNHYGPTETTVTATIYTATSAVNQLERLPIGRPISNTCVYVLDKYLTPVPHGVVGELYISGPGVANGYLNRPDLTAERFLPDPFAKVQGARMFKTGDLVRYLPDGNLVFVGRNDNQVKIRGFRVELGEIEARLAEHPQVREAVVLVLGDSSDNKRLVAYIEAVPDESLVRTLREYLSIRLPEYMIPSAFVRMDVFPLTNNGKIDRRALPEPSNDSLATSDYVAPQGDLETALAAIWSDLLNVEQVGRHDNFFMLGGHSLLAVRLMNRVLDFGVHMPLSTLFSSPTLCALGEALESSANLQGSTHPVIVPAARDSPLELSFAQQRLWFLAQMDGLSEIYHVPFASRLHGPLNRDALEKTLNALFCRHESLRTVFVAIDGHPQVQLLPPDNGFPLVIRDLRGEQDGEAIARQLAAQESRTPFDLENGPLVRAQLIQLADDEHLFLITMHHIVTDGWSMGVMIREVNMLYEAYSSGLHNPLAPLSIQYPDYAVWQRQWLKQDKRKDQAAYWRENLAGAPAYIELPTDRPRPHQQSFSGASVPIRFDSQLTGALKSLSQKHGATMFMTTLAAWSAVLSRLSGQDDIVIGTPSANRNHQQLEQLIGFFVSTLVLRIDLSEEPSAIQLLERVRKTAIAAQAHQDIPFEQVVEIVQPPRRTDMTPLFQVMFAWQDEDHGTLKLHGIGAVSEDLYDISKFELQLYLSEENGEIVGGLNYSTALFDCETIGRHVGYLEAMLRWMADSTEESIDRAPILGADERELLLQTWNNTEKPYPDNTCIHRLFENQVELSPEAIAIVHDERSLTYRQLNSMANEIACQLIDAGVKPGDYVMLLLDRSIGLVASQIAVLKIGAAYVPVDTKAPVDRQAYIASDCRSMVLITEETIVVPPGIQATVLRIGAKQKHIERRQDTFEGLTTSSLDTAYVMYTSGSTGLPKGVVVHHRGIARLVVNNGFAEICPTDRMTFTTNPAFDPSTYQVWAPLVHGASIVVIDTETFMDPFRLAEALTRHQVTCMYMTHGVLHHYALLIGSTLSKLKYLLGGAEQGLIKAYMAVLNHGGPVRLVNRYGPTETTVSATAYTASSAINQLERLPIGRPISNTRAYVLDKHLAPVPIGVVGELYVGGAGVTHGYLNRPELTAERFLQDPFAKVQGARMYKTGDLVYYLSDGNLVFVGRNDNQVKIRGFRVELGEIDARLTEHPQVREAVVIAISGNSGDNRLVAYVVAEPQENLVRVLREYLSVSLPEYMVPSAFVRMDAFPLTNNGKINRRALPEPSGDSLVTCGYVAPQGEHEIALAKMWSDLLKVERVGRHDNFFTLGGHSLLAVRMINIVRSSLGVDLKLHVLFSAPTVAELATNLVHGYVKNAQDDEYSVLIPLKTQGCRAPLFCVHSGLGLSWSYRGLAQNLHPEQPLYGLQARGLDGKSPLATSVQEMTLDYIDQIRKIQPEGPYLLLGWSFGGKIAHNMAVELQRQGDTVSLLAILDTIPGGSGEEEAESSFQDEGEDYDEFVDGVVGDSSADDALAFKMSAKPIFFNSARLARSFAPSVYNGDILFFRATVPYQMGKQLIDPSCWRPYTRGDVEVHDVECKHEDMKTSKNLAVVAHIVAEWIEKLH